jgi:predicted enzyme related to lactoylglutathione lyase
VYIEPGAVCGGGIPVILRFMPEIDKHKPGAFSWIELSTTDQNGAKAFYTSLFGWAFEDSPMGPGDVYTMFNLKGRVPAAAYTQRADENAMGVPSHWNLYINVESADDAAKRASELGGKVLAPPFDVATHGRMAVLQDPTGGVFSIWQPIQYPGMGIKDEPGSFCWADLNTPDPAAAGAFYAKLFGWELEPARDTSGYLHIKNAGDYIGGIPPAAQRNPNAPPHWMIYILVSDCDASTAKAKELGATVYMGPMTMEKVGRIAVLADPQGAVSALFEQHRG